MAEKIIDLNLKERKKLYELSLNARAPVSAIVKKNQIVKTSSKIQY